MEERQNKWEKLTKIPEEYPQNSEIARGVIAELGKERVQPRKTAWFARHWKKLAAVCTSLVLAIGVGIGVYTSTQSPEQPNIVYYDEVSLQTVEVVNVDSFVEQKGFRIKYFATSTTKTWYTSVAETDEPAYLMQELLCISSSGFDQINLKIALLGNAVFDFENLFEHLTNSTQILNINILYHTMQGTQDNSQVIYAKMEYEGVAYYFEILSEGDAKSVVEQYATMLLG